VAKKSTKGPKLVDTYGVRVSVETITWFQGLYARHGLMGSELARAILESVARAVRDGRPKWPYDFTFAIRMDDGRLACSDQTLAAAEIPADYNISKLTDEQRQFLSGNVVLPPPETPPAASRERDSRQRGHGA
jgi:hypothetical protein